MAKKNKAYIPSDYNEKMNQWIRLSQTVPTVSASLDPNRRHNYIDPGSISMEDALADPWKYKILDESGETPNDYSWIDHISDAFTDWKIKQNDTNIDTRNADLLEFNKNKNETQTAIDYINVKNRINEIQTQYPEWQGSEELQQEMVSLFGILESTKSTYDKVSNSISGFNKLNEQNQLNKLSANLQSIDQQIEETNKTIKEYQDANDYWKNKHKISDWYQRKSEDVDLSFTDPDTYLYGLAGLIGSSSSSWKTQLASAAIGIGASLAAPFTGGASLAVAAPVVLGLNLYGASEENKAELYQHYKDKVRQLSEADGSLKKVFEKNEKRFGKTDLSDDQNLDILLTGAIDNDDQQFNKNRLKAYEHLDDLYQDDMWAVGGDAVLNTTLQLMPIGKIAKATRLGKFGKKTKQFADKTAELHEKLHNKIDDIVHFGLDKTAKGLASHTTRDYVFDVVSKTMVSSASEMIEESNQYLNGQKYMQDQYGNDQSHFESIWDNIAQGAKAAYSFYAPWDTALSSDEEWLKNARGGALLGGIMTGTVRTLGNARNTARQREIDEFVSHLAMSDRLYEKDLLQKSKIYADKALRNRESQLINSFDRLANMEGVDSELVNAEKQRALRIMQQAKDKKIQSFAKDNLNIDPYSEDYKNFIALQDYYIQMYRDSNEEYASKLKEYENAVSGMAQKGYLDQIVDDSDMSDYAERIAYVKNRIDYLSRLEAYKQLKKQFEEHSANASELSKMGISVNKQDVDSFLTTINQRIDGLQKQLDESVSDYEGTVWATAIDEYTDLYKNVALHEINNTRAINELNLFDPKSLKVDEIKSRLKKMNEVYKADQKLEQDIQDDHTGYTQEQEQETINSAQPETKTESEVKEQPVVQHSPEQSQGKLTEESEVKYVEEPEAIETPVVTEPIPEPLPEDSSEILEESPDQTTDVKKELETLREAIRVKRLENVTTDVKTEKKSQRKLTKMRDALKKAGSNQTFTDEELKQQPYFKFEENKYGKALTQADTAILDVYNSVIDDVINQTTEQELARQAYYEGWVTEEQLTDAEYSFNEDKSIDDKAKLYLRDKLEKFKRGETKPYFMQQYLDNLEETNANKEILALYDEIITSRDSLTESIFNTDDTSVLDKHTEKINSSITALKELLNSTESQQQSEQLRKKVIDYSKTADAQLDGIVGNTYEDNQAYILNSVKPDFITNSEISFDLVDDDVHIIFNYKGQLIHTKFKPARNNEQLLDKFINYIHQVKTDPSKRIELIGLARTAGVYHEAATPIKLNESELWQGIDILDIDASTVNVGVTIGTGGQVSVNGETVHSKTTRIGMPVWIYRPIHLESKETKPLQIALQQGRFTNTPGIAAMILNLMLSQDRNVIANGIVTPFSPKQLLDMLVLNGEKTIVYKNNNYTPEQLEARLRKQFYLDGKGNLVVGNTSYSIIDINSNPNVGAQIVKYIQDNFTYNIDSDSLNKFYGGADGVKGNPFNGLKAWFQTSRKDKLVIVPGELEFTAEEMGLQKNQDGSYSNSKIHPRGISMLGWYIKQGALMTSVDRLQNANLYIKDVALVDKIEEIPATPEQIISAPEQFDSNAIPNLEDLFKDLTPLDDSLFGPNYLSKGYDGSKIDINAAREYVKRTLGLIDDQIDITDSIIGVTHSGMYVMGRARLDAIALSELAPEGTEYHETWHRVSLLLIDEKQRQKIYNRERKKYQDGITDTQLEEELAEKFKHFMLDEDIQNIDFQAKNWFRRILNFIKVWSKLGSFKMAKLYYDINRGKFANVKPFEENVKRFKALYADEGPNFEVRGVELDNIPTRYDYDSVLNSLAYATIQLNIGANKSVSNLFNEVDKIDFNVVKNAFKCSSNPVINEIYEKWDTVFAKDLSAKLEAMSLKVKEKQFREEQEAVDSGDINNKNGEYDKASYEVSLYENAPAAVKFFFNTIPSYTYDSAGNRTLKKDRLTNLPQFVNPHSTWNIMNNDLASANSIQEMYDKVCTLAENDLLYAAIRDRLYRVIQNSKSKDHKTAIDAEVMLTQIYTVVHSHIHDFTTVKTQELENGMNSVKIIDNTVDVKSKSLPGQWNQQLMRTVFIQDNEGNINWVKDGKHTVQMILNRFNQLKHSVLSGNYEVKGVNYDLNTPFGLDKAKNDIVKLLNMLGISIDMGTLNTMLKSDIYSKNNIADKGALNNFLHDTSNETYGGITNLFNLFASYLKSNNLNNIDIKRGGDVIATPTVNIYSQNGFIKELAKNYVQYHSTSDELRSYAAEGNLLYPKSQNNFATDRTSELNNDETLKEKFRNNAYSESSLILDSLLDPSVKISAETFVNFKTSNNGDNGSDYFGINAKEDYISKLTLTANDRIVFPTVADKKTYHTIKGIKLFHDKVEINDIPGVGRFMSFSQVAVDRMIKYAYSDLHAIEQCIKELEGYTDEEGVYHAPITNEQKIKNYHTKAKYKVGDNWFTTDPNGTRFRFLTKIYTWEQEEDKNDKTKKVWVEKEYDFSDTTVSSKDLVTLAKNKFFNKPIEAQRSIINYIIQKRVEEELKYAEQLGILVNDNGVYGSFLIDYGQQQLRAKNYMQQGQLEPTQEDISRALIEIIADNTINTIISINEIERLYHGDPAFYKWEYVNHKLLQNSIDKIKRLGALTSTGTNNRMDIEGLPTDYTCAELNDFEKGSDMYATTIKPLFLRGNVITAVKQIHGQSALFDDEGNQYTVEQLQEKYPDAYKYAEKATEDEAKGYSKDINVADAAVYVTPEMYRNMMRMIGEWGIDQEEAYETIMSDDNSWLSDPVVYKKMHTSILKPLKYMAFGTRFNDKGLAIPYFNKMALFPVFNYMATGDMKALYDTMKDRKIDMVLFNSALKAGSQNATDFYSENGKVNDLTRLTTYKQSFKYLRHQLKTDPHTHEEQMLGTQMQKVALSNLGMNEKYGKNLESTGSEIKYQVFSSMNALSNLGRKRIESEICNEDGTVSEEKLAKVLYKDAESQGANDNILNALVYKDGKMSLPLSALSDNSWIESRFISYINKHTIDIDMPGGAFIQRSVFGLASTDERFAQEMMLNNGQPLKLINEEGSMDAIISINMFKYIIPNYNNLTFDQAREWLIKNNIIGNNENIKANAIGYRIPTQSQASISALRFVDVLPEVMGDTVILPEEFTKLTGSDFDVDKLFIARYSYDKNGNIIQFDSDKSHDENSAEANKNNLLDNYMKVLLTKDHTNELKISIDNDTENVKEVLRDIESIQNPEYLNPLYQYSPKYQSLKKDEYTSGKAGIGPFALNNAHHVLTQLVDMKMASNAFTKQLGLIELGKFYDDEGVNRSGNRTRVLSWLSALINAFVDIAKDPYIVRLNVNAYTYNIAAYLTRMGKGEATYYFLNQPIMKDIAQAVLKTRGKYGVDQHVSQSQREKAAIEKVLKKYDHKTHAGSFKNLITDEQKAEMFSELLNSTQLRNLMMQDRNDENFNYSQIYIYYGFLELNEYAEAMSDLVKYSKIDTKKMGKTFAEQHIYNNGIEELMQDSRFAAGEVKRFFDETFLQVKRQNSIDFGAKMFQGQLIRNTDAFVKMQDMILDKINRKSSATEKILKPIIRSMEAAVKSEFFNQLMVKEGINAKDLLYGNRSMASRLLNLKQSILSGKVEGYLNPDGTFNNYLLDYLMANIGKNETLYQKPDFINKFSMFDTDVVGQNSLIDSWQELYDDERTNKFAKDLAIYAFITTGDNPSMNNFFKYLSNKIKKEFGYDKFITATLNSFNSGSSININWKDIFLNNWQNNDLVKPLEYETSYVEISKNPSTGEEELMVNKYKFINIPSKFSAINGKYTVMDSFLGVRNKNRDNIKPIGYFRYIHNDGIELSAPKYPPFVKIKYSNDNAPHNTLVYELIGIIEQSTVGEKDNFIPVYKIINKKGYRMHGNVITEYGRTDGYSFNNFPSTMDNETALKTLSNRIKNVKNLYTVEEYNQLENQTYDDFYDVIAPSLEKELNDIDVALQNVTIETGDAKAFFKELIESLNDGKYAASKHIKLKDGNTLSISNHRGTADNYDDSGYHLRIVLAVSSRRKDFIPGMTKVDEFVFTAKNGIYEGDVKSAIVNAIHLAGHNDINGAIQTLEEKADYKNISPISEDEIKRRDDEGKNIKDQCKGE